jgi:isoquinoline 1-oxidoreductase subunit beta
MDMAPRALGVHVVASEAKPAGVGEPGVPPFAPALCNAIFAATGTRIRRLPVGEQLAKGPTVAGGTSNQQSAISSQKRQQ